MNSSQETGKYPYIRRARPDDYAAIWEIWMQPHIRQWMSFPELSKEDFINWYKKMDAKSEIYVLVELEDEKEAVVGVRRIKFGEGEGPYQHTAEYCSMGVHADYQGKRKGYGELFYTEFEKILRDRGIKRVQLTQSGGNEAAFHIADKLQFLEEAIFPDWLMRGELGHYYLIERFIYRFLDPEFAELAAKIPSLKLKYQTMVPHLLMTEENAEIHIERIQDQFICTYQNKPLLTVNFSPDTTVIQHIGFLDMELHTQDHQNEAKIALVKVLQAILEEGRVKKLELFTHDPAVIKLCEQLGFFVRGERMASYYDKDKDEFKNELGLEYSFFNIDDAWALIREKVPDMGKREQINKALRLCRQKIQILKRENVCDNIGAKYLENLAYQMVRDELGPNKVFSLAEKPWKSLLDKIPAALQTDILRLQNRLQAKTALSLFQTETMVTLGEQAPMVSVKKLK